MKFFNDFDDRPFSVPTKSELATVANAELPERGTCASAKQPRSRCAARATSVLSSLADLGMFGPFCLMRRNGPATSVRGAFERAFPVVDKTDLVVLCQVSADEHRLGSSHVNHRLLAFSCC